MFKNVQTSLQVEGHTQLARITKNEDMQNRKCYVLPLADGVQAHGLFVWKMRSGIHGYSGRCDPDGVFFRFGSYQSEDLLMFPS